MSHLTRFITVFATATVIGCSAAEDPSIASNDSPAETTEGQVLNEITVAGETIQFLEYQSDGDRPVFILHNTASAYVKQTILDRLESEVGALTLLETFFALAPAGTAPHADLERLHAEQVAALGRADASVKRVAFDVNAPVEKSAAGCDNWANLNAFPGNPWDSQFNNNANMPNGGNVGRLCRAMNGLPACDRLSTQGQLVGMCNDGPGAVIVFDEWRTNSQGWKREKFSIIVDPGHQQGWRMAPTNDLLKTQVLGITSTDDPDFITPAYYVRARATQF